MKDPSHQEEALLTLLAPRVSDTTVLSAPPPVTCSLVYPKMWLHPSDVDLFCKGLGLGNASAPSPTVTRAPRRTTHAQSHSGGSGALSMDPTRSPDRR